MDKTTRKYAWYLGIYLKTVRGYPKRKNPPACGVGRGANTPNLKTLALQIVVQDGGRGKFEVRLLTEGIGVQCADTDPGD
jgi:hypothetical protein